MKPLKMSITKLKMSITKVKIWKIKLNIKKKKKLRPNRSVQSRKSLDQA